MLINNKSSGAVNSGWRNLPVTVFFLGIGLILIPGLSWAPYPLFDISGNPIAANSRPIIMGTYEGLYQLLLYSRSMKEPGNETGFLHILLADPDRFQEEMAHPLSLKFVREETQAFRLGQHFTQMSLISNTPFDHNGRVVLVVHGGKSGNIEIELNEQRVTFDTKELGKKLGLFFKKYNIKVDILDVFTCCGTEVLPRLAEGLKSSGYNNVLVSGFHTDVVAHPSWVAMLNKAPSADSVAINYTIKDSVTGKPTPKEYKVPCDEYFVRGSLGALPKELIFDIKIGNPAPVIPPSLPDYEGCQP